MTEARKKKKISNHNLVLISVISAVIIWFIVGTFINPTDTRYVSGIPVQIEGSSVLDALGLSVVEGGNQSITVRVSGPKLTISSLTASDFIALPRFSAISAPGVYTLDIDIALSSNAGSVTIESHSPQSLTVRLARLDEKTFDIDYSVRTEIPDGYVLSDVAISEPSVVVVGEKSELESIASACVFISSFDETTRSLAVNLLDKDGNVINNDSLSLSVSQTQVTTTLNKTKEVKLIAGISGADGHDLSGLVTRTVTPSVITVSAAEDVINTISDSYVIDNIPLSEISGDSEKTVPLKLPSGASVIDGADTVTVSTSVRGLATKHIELSDIRIDSSLADYKIKITTQKLSVTVMCPVSGVSSLGHDSLVATVIYNVGQTPPAGRYSMPVRITSTKSNVWAVGEYYVNVTVE